MSNDDRENEQLVPIANVARIMKKGLPENAKISKEAKETVQECTTEFISFVASEASDRCLHEKRKTIVADDILWALESLGFDNYSTYLQKYLQEFRDVTKRKDKVEDDQDVVNPVTNAQFQMATLIGQHQSGRMNYEETGLPGMD